MKGIEPNEDGRDTPSADSRNWQAGATAIEYGLIAAFVALAIITGTIVAGNGLGDLFFTLADMLQNASTS
jgi:pilus assembly protein Flp/PilA